MRDVKATPVDLRRSPERHCAARPGVNAGRPMPLWPCPTAETTSLAPIMPRPGHAVGPRAPFCLLLDRFGPARGNQFYLECRADKLKTINLWHWPRAYGTLAARTRRVTHARLGSGRN